MKPFKKLIQSPLILLIALLLSVSSASMAETELMAVDRGFNKMVQEKGLVAAFDFYLASNSLSLNGPYEGYDRDDFVVWFKENDGKHKMKWWPVNSEISASKDIGYTWGRYEEQTIQDDGAIVEKSGKYITVWRKNANGEWKSTVDMGANYPTKPDSQ